MSDTETHAPPPALLAGSNMAPPQMPSAPSGIVELPCGLIKDNELITSAQVRELIGSDEEFLSKRDVDKSWPVFITDILQRGVVDIGGDKPDRDALRGLLVGDRLQLLLAIRKVSYGPTLSFNLDSCTSCGRASEIIVSLDDPEDIPMVEMEDRITRVFPVDLTAGLAEVGLLNGAAHEAVYTDASKRTSSEINTVMITQTLISVNGIRTNGQRERALSLSGGDRQTLVKFHDTHIYGPQLKEIWAPCSWCEQKYPIILGLSNLFRF